MYRATRMPALSLAYLAAHTPENWDVKIVDETVEPFDAWKHVEGSDIVGFNGGNVCNIHRLTDHISRVTEYDQVMGEETPIILGGYVGGLNIEGLPNRVDARVIGPGELALQELLADFENGGMKREYVGQRVPMNELRTPDFSGFNVAAYGKNVNWPVMTSVSCGNTCGFCSARVVYGDGYASRSPEKVLADMAQFDPDTRLYFVDPNVLQLSRNGKRRARKLFKGMAKQNHPWFGSATFRVSEDERMLEAMAESGCKGLLIGFDSALPESLQTVSAPKYRVREDQTLIEYYVEGVKRIQEKFGIDVLGTFVIGFDTDDERTIANTIRVVQDSGMKDAQYLPFTPLPGTPSYNEMEAAGRIIDHNLNRYDFTDVVFRPQNFSGAELRDSLVKMYDETFPRMLAIYRRFGLVRDRPELIKVESMKLRAEREERAARERERRGRRRGGGGGHH